MSEFGRTIRSAEEIIAAIPLLKSQICSLGATISDNIEFRKDSLSGVGIFSSTNIAEGAVLMSVPFTSCISSDMVVNNAHLKRIFEDNPGLLDYPDEVVAIGLMFARTVSPENQNECEWFQHVGVMPLEFNTPLYWNESEVEELRPCSVFQLTKLLKNQIANDWRQIHQPLSTEYPESLGSITEDLYVWSLSVIYSRAVGIHRHGKYVRCIPPVIDMANHSPYPGKLPENTFAYVEGIDHVQLVNMTSKAVGDEIYAVYGNYPNSKLMYTYGFVLVDCPDRAIDIWARVPPNLTMATEKQSLLNSHQLTSNQTYDFDGTIRDGFVSPALLATIRIIQMVEAEVEFAANAFVGRMISYRNELATYSALRALLVARMQVDVAENDRLELGEHLLTGGSLTDRKAMALIVKVGERELLQEIVSLIDSWIEELVGCNGENYQPPDSLDHQVL